MCVFFQLYLITFPRILNLVSIMFFNIMSMALLLLPMFLSIVFAEENAHINASLYRSPTENLHLKLFEGDIILRKGFFLERSVLKNAQNRWPDGVVYYTLDTLSYSEEDIEVIKSAMEEFEQRTCIRWKERTDEDNYIEIENDIGCSSEVGMQEGGQSIYLESPRCMKKGVVMHEMMHALGFLHEMSRPDRDDYISIEWDNIIPGMQENFKKLPEFMVDDLGLPYDYKSIMHYKAWAFAKDNTHPTSIPKDSSVNLSDLGEGETEGKFTDNDLEKIKIFYEC